MLCMVSMSVVNIAFNRGRLMLIRTTAALGIQSLLPTWTAPTWRVCARLSHWRKSWRKWGQGDESPKIWSDGDANANRPPRILSRFKVSSSRLPALQSGKMHSVKLAAVSICQISTRTTQYNILHIYKAHHVTTSCEKFNIFFLTKYHQEFTKTYRFNSDIYFFQGSGPSLLPDLSSVGGEPLE